MPRKAMVKNRQDFLGQVKRRFSVDRTALEWLREVCTVKEEKRIGLPRRVLEKHRRAPNARNSFGIARSGVDLSGYFGNGTDSHCRDLELLEREIPRKGRDTHSKGSEARCAERNRYEQCWNCEAKSSSISEA